ncbi:MAG: phosphoribosyl-ATP diphosphatase [Proteobacteria bacterium]|nr:phosphoribosyl-ATP diphosphatase [Pseudomonadota bacterium]
MTEPAPHPIDRLFATIKARKDADPASSYTAKLFHQGKLKIAKKLGEEGVEAALAAVAQDRDALIAESADVLYHLLVLWAACDVTPEDAYAALEARTHRSGIEEKKSRKE